ncbi:MAG: polysaccharide deacetylase family protein [Candidatus Aminicenantales bacterium]
MTHLNLLTFDIEEWFQANYRLPGERPMPERDSRLERNVERLLAICARHGATATFFVLGETAERHPGLVGKIKRRGHEIASHGYRHSLIYDRTPQEFAADLRKSIGLLENLAGEKVRGFRAPSWSVGRHMNWFFSLLAENGLAYDSSLFPLKTFLYGDSRAKAFPHKINDIVELPASTFRFLGKRIPFASGFFFRFFSSSVIRRAVRSLNRRGLPAMICLHPREIDPSAPRLPLPPRERFIHYHNIHSTERKLERLLGSFRFVSIREYLNL